jgi:hypothetical protein
MIENEQCRKGGCGCVCEKRSKHVVRKYRKEDYDGCWQGTDEGEEE